MLRMSRSLSARAFAATIFRSASVIAAVTAGASSALAFDDTPSIIHRESVPGSTQYAQNFFERLFGVPTPPQDNRTPGGRERGSRDTLVRSRDASGKPGPSYRVLGVVPKQQPTSRTFSQGERWKKKIAQDLLKAPPAPPTQGPLLLAVSIAKQTVTMYDAGVAVAKSPVSTGTVSNPTPTGIFSVIEKQWWHRSNLYSAAPMPYMQRLTWSGIALHAGDLPGYAASHGCIRLPESFALRLWGTTKIGARVIITRDEVVPTEIKHARLFAPRPKPEPAVEPAPEIVTPPENKPEPIVPPEIKPMQEEMSVSIDAPVQVAAATPLVDYVGPPQAPAPKPAPTVAPFVEYTAPKPAPAPRAAPAPRVAPVIVTPPAFSGGGPRVIVVADALAQLNNTQQTAVAPPAADEDDPADTEIDDATRQALQQVELIDPERSVINGTVEVTISVPGQPAQTVLLSVEKMPADAGTTPEREPSVMLASLDGSDLPLPARASTDTQVARRAKAAAAEPVSTQPKVLRPGPLSILISRSEKRMYVRKGLQPLFEVPVTIEKNNEAIGTHIFTAVASDDPAAMRWMVVSLDSAPRAGQVADARNVAGKRIERVEPKLKPTVAARAALDRLDLPKDAVDRISDLMSVGATLIVSDKGIGRRAAAALDSDFMIEMP